MRLFRSLRRTVDRFFTDPASIRNAALLTTTATMAAVFAGAVVVRILDHKEYPTFGRALWFTLQTVTTVGYGDVTPTSPVGRVVAAVVMLSGIGFITIVTAAITSVFVEAMRERARKGADSPPANVGDRAADLASVNARLDQIEQSLNLLLERTRPS
jgi:voltage-gated potassium channel